MLPAPDHIYCSEHLIKFSIRAQNKRKSNRLKGLCACGGLVPQGRKLCVSCSESSSQNSRLYRTSEKGKKKARNRAKERYWTDTNYRFQARSRAIIRKGLRQQGIKKFNKTVALIGCTWNEYRLYIESLWEPWMTWENYGSLPGQWEIDHILPIVSFDLQLQEY